VNEGRQSCLPSTALSIVQNVALQCNQAVCLKTPIAEGRTDGANLRYGLFSSTIV
jgi:hypothetical protein